MLAPQPGACSGSNAARRVPAVTACEGRRDEEKGTRLEARGQRGAGESPKSHPETHLLLPGGTAGVEEVGAGLRQVPVEHLQHPVALHAGLQPQAEELLHLQGDRARGRGGRGWRGRSHSPAGAGVGAAACCAVPCRTFRYWMARWTFQPWFCRAAWHSSVVTPCTMSCTWGRLTVTPCHQQGAGMGQGDTGDAPRGSIPCRTPAPGSQGGISASCAGVQTPGHLPVPSRDGHLPPHPCGQTTGRATLG